MNRVVVGLVVLAALLLTPNTTSRSLSATSGTPSTPTATSAPPSSSATRAGLTVQIVAARQRCKALLLDPGLCFEEVTLHVSNRRQALYRLYAPEFLLLTSEARASYESAADTALAHQIVTSPTVPPHSAVTAAVAFVVSTHDRLAAVQWGYHQHDPGLTGIDPTAEQVLLLLPGVTRAPVPAGPVGSLTLHGVTVAVQLHVPRRPTSSGLTEWVVTVSLRNQSALPLYYSVGSFALLDAQGLTHPVAALAPPLRPLPDSAVLAPGHAVSGRVAALFPAGLRPVAVRWTSLQFGAHVPDWVIRLPATLLPAPTPTPQRPVPQPQVYTVIGLLQTMEQDPQAVLRHIVRVRGVVLWAPPSDLMLVDTQLIHSMPSGLNAQQAAFWVLAILPAYSAVPVLFVQAPHPSRYGQDLTPRVYRVDLHPLPCHAHSLCRQGTLLGT